jgi:TPR repeat protein
MKLRPTLLEMPPGTRIVANTFTMEDWEADDTQTVTNNCSSWCTALLWVVPAKVEGVWDYSVEYGQLRGGGELKITQRFQYISGSLDGRPISQGRLRGASVTFTEGDTTYTGQVDGSKLRGPASGRPWTATRTSAPRTGGPATAAPPDATAAAIAVERKACDGGDAAACIALGRRYLMRNGVSYEPSQAVALYGRACELGAQEGCWNLADAHVHVVAVRDEARATKLLQPLCDGGGQFATRACMLLGDLHRTGRGVPRDVAKAVALYNGVCESGVLSGCWTLSDMYLRGDGVARNEALGAALLQRVCDGPANAVHLLACTDLAQLYTTGRGVPKDLARAIQLEEKACPAVGRACANLGDKYERGEGVARDLVRARQLYQKGCAGGSQGACDAAARLAR